MLYVASPPAGGAIETHFYLAREASALRTTYLFIALLAGSEGSFIPRNDTANAFICIASCENAITSRKLIKSDIV
jgi:hypothetical protein